MNTCDQKYTGQRIATPPEFEDIFSHFYIAENKTVHAIQRTLVPTFQTIMVFSFGATISFSSYEHTKIEIDKCMILGPIKQPLVYTLPAGAEMLVANFKDDAFYRFFGQVILSDHMPVNPDDLLNENCFTNLWQLLKNAVASDRINLILDFCKPYLKNRDTSFVSFANLKNDYTVFNPIKVIAEQTAQSERTVQLKHKKYFGYTAKEKSRYQKFVKAIELLQNQSKKVDWFDIIDKCGYYDQSQLIHDFKHFLNLSPKQYLKFQSAICKATLE